MGLVLPQTVKVRTNGSICKHYKEKGYEFEKCGDLIEVNVLDLPKGSNIKVKVVCDICGKITEMRYARIAKYNEENKLIICGNKICKNKKREDTCMKKYGVKHAFQAEEVKEKTKQTNLKNWGVEYASQAEEVKEKIKQTNLKNWGVEYTLQSEEKNLVNIFKNTWNQTLSAIKIVWSSLTGMLTGRFSVKDMSGPIGIVSAIGNATNEGLKTSVFVAFINIMALMALITINLGVFNLLPLPALDGGRLMFLLFEMITHKKLNPKYEGFIHTLGFFLFIAFTIYISYADILRLLGKS